VIVFEENCMPTYETLCILHPELPDARVKEISAWMQKILEGAKSTTVHVDEWGMRDLTYLLRKQRRGYYVRLEYEAPPAALKELERNLRINEHVLRYFSTVYTAPPAPPPSVPSTPAPSAAPAGDEAGQQ
jgi:small subunit ribosomal protein S6